MNKKCTPGPWDVDAFRPHVIASGFTVAACDASDHFGPNEQEANARLIASAPLLLEALRKVARVKGVAFDYDLDALDEAIAAARAAILAATGGGE
jgi:hypothetical protein